MILAAAWSPDGQRIATASYDNTARVWFADGHGEPTVFQGHEEAINDVAFSPDGKLIATAGWDSTLRIFNVNGQRPPIVLRHRARVLSARFNAEGNRVITASWDHTLRVWNLIVLHHGSGWLKASDLSPNGKQLVVPSWDGTIAILSDLERLSGPNDARLWTASTYCLTVEQRMKILGVSEELAKADLDACLRRVNEARARTMRP